VSRLVASTHDSDSGHEVVRPFFDDVKGGGMSCSIPYDAPCQSLYVLYFFLAGCDAMFAIGGRWGNGRDGFAYRP